MQACMSTDLQDIINEINTLCVGYTISIVFWDDVTNTICYKLVYLS